MLPKMGWRAAGRRTLHHSASRHANPAGPKGDSSQLTGAAKLFADAIEEESSKSPSSRDHLRHTQGPVWTGDESQPDAVLRMLVDAYKPLRTGEGVKHDAADKKIKGWMKGLNLEPRLGPGATLPSREPGESASQEDGLIATDADQTPVHRTTMPPHLHRPWHATYTGDTQDVGEAKIKYGMFIKRKVQADELTNLLELQLPPDADAKTRARVRELKKAGKVARRYENAKEGALDYRLGVSEGSMMEIGEDGEEKFIGNRQMKGSSVLGAQKGSASGMKAWSGLVEDRIQRAREAGFFNITKGKGKPIPRDPEASNPHIEHGELLMNRIVKRQGALPPWIELQNNLDTSLEAFRSTLLSTYSTHVVRSVISTTSLDPLPPLHTIPVRDELWEAREHKFHQENVRQINDLVRRMNAVAPSIVRRPLVTLDAELNKVRGDVLKTLVWEQVNRRAEEIKMRPDGNLATSQPKFFNEISKLRRAAHRSLSTIARPVSGMIGRPAAEKSNGGGESSNANRNGLGVVAVIGLGIAGYAYFRKPILNDSAPMAPSTTAANHQTMSVREDEESTGIFSVFHIYILEPILTFFRFIHLAALFGPVILTSPMLLVGRTESKRRRGKPVAEDEENWGAVWWYGFLVAQMERAGPSFIKLGQWAASRADLFPASLCDKMSKLHSNGVPHPYSHTKRVISKAFGLKFEDIFEEFGEEPIGCGAIAQVYKAKLRPEVIASAREQSSRPLHVNRDPDEAPTTSVAIKVLHPRARKTIRRDIAIMSIFANVINLFPGMEWLSLPDEVSVFGEMMNSQLDLRVEAANLDKFDVNFQKRGRTVSFPKPIKLGDSGEYAHRFDESKDVLMEEFEDALPLKHFLRNGGGPFDEKIANIGLDAFLEMLLLDNWTHGDLHPGNIMVRFFKPTTKDYLGPLISRFTKPAAEEAIPTHSISATDLVHELSGLAHDSDKWLERLDQLSSEGYVPQLIFIDAGLVTSLDNENRRNFLDLFQAVAEFDGYKAGKLMVERCKTPEHVIDEETFALKIQHLVLSVKSKTFSLAKIKISDILTDVLTAVRQHHVKLEGDFVNTVISILLLEGIGRQLDPNMDLFKSALPILRQVGRQMGTREAISAVPKGNIWAMAKLWVYIEAREVAGEVGAIDDWIKYDRLTPSM